MKTLTLGLVISALGTSAAVAALGSVNNRIASIGQTVEKLQAKRDALGLGTVDAFRQQKEAVVQLGDSLKTHQQTTTALGKKLAEAKVFQDQATASVKSFRQELDEQTGKATDAQKLKLKLLGEQAKGAEKDVKALSSEFEGARSTSRRMDEQLIQQTAQLQKLRAELNRNGIATADLAAHRVRITKAMEQEQATIDRLTQRYQQLRAVEGMHANNRADFNSRLGDAAAAYGMSRMLGAPVAAFMRQDEALNTLQVTMMDKNGQVNGSYAALKKQVVELGNLLPGTTADFAGTANALMEQGVAIGSVLNGGLKAASYLSVVLKMPSDQAGEMAAKLREAYSLSDNELTKMADSMQRAKFAFGMKPGDLMAASSYQAPMLNQLGIKGQANMDKMLALQGEGAMVGLEGSSFGTNFSMMLSRLAKGPIMLAEAKKGMKAEARGIMDQMGLTFDFFDKKGNFAGLDNMVKELEKLKTIKERLGDKAAMEVSEAMFGAEAGRPAMIIAEQGVAGFAEAQKRMQDQADLQQRIKKTTESSRNTWEALTGSVENFAAAAVGPAVQSLHPLVNGLNAAAGALTDFADRNPTATKWLGLTVAALGGGTVAVLSLGVAFSALRLAWTGAQLVPGVLALMNGAGWLGAMLKGPLVAGLRLAGGAVMFLGRALLMNPIGLAVTGIALGALLIYRNWEPLSGWFKKTWATVKEYTASAVSYFKALPGQFMKFGSDMIDGLLSGISSKMTSARESITGLGQNIKGWFASTLGIHSPSRVFMGFGDNIGQGTALGLLGSMPGVKAAVGALAGVALSAVSVPTDGLSHRVSQSLASITSVPAQPSAHGSAAGMTVHFSPTINVPGGDAGAVRAQVDQALQMSLREFEQLYNRMQAQQARRSLS
jgi:TP901 family phage tail tape measure protein